MKVCRILGIRGLPANHGGFETFAEWLALYLSKNHWKVVVYCQQEGKGSIWTDDWLGIERVHIPVKNKGPLGTIIFDLMATWHAARRGGVCLTLGYNTAIFTLILRLFRRPNIINMDGIEWKRAKWGGIAKFWFWLNDWLGCLLGTHLIADHPEIKKHLASRVSEKKISMIPYGAVRVSESALDVNQLYELQSQRYMILIARPEPENSVLEIVKAFSIRRRDIKLVVLGNYEKTNSYHSQVVAAASDEVVFLGAIYDKSRVESLRFNAMAYLHGHQVGGTNPSLVESLGAGNAVIAHDNVFNRWVAQEGALYFSTEQQLDSIISNMILRPNDHALLREASLKRFESTFTWPSVLSQYENLLSNYIEDSN